MSREIIFISDPKELKIDNCIIYFYINDNFIHKKIKSILKNNISFNNIYCVNLKVFENYIKIYNLEKFPTLIFFKDKKEKLRIDYIINNEKLKKLIYDIYKL